MNSIDCKELYFLLDADGAVVAYQEKEQSWAGALAFSSEALARNFLQVSHLEVAEIVAVETEDQPNLRTLIAALKRRPIRYLLLDLDYQSGVCRQVDFEGDGLGAIRQRQFAAARAHGG
ncbi:MAG: hypothetical protein JOZ29_21105 [Deltaproteobacteria bacterium]|nr:hypothetical protein [Deltaproteobacteria bacterium]MBV8454744.1 hypothetical protein [Deltaproteobacteria bacterium]